MLAKGAYKGSTHPPMGALTAVVDTNDTGYVSVNGNRYLTVVGMMGSSFPACAPGSKKDSMSTARRWRMLKTRIEAIADPGGAQKIQVIKHL